MKVIVMVGLPGSGKTTWIEKNHPDAIVVSADAFFVEEDGTYKFRPQDLREAHGACLRNFEYHLRSAEPDATVIVDNVNASLIEMAPYVAFAQAYDADLEIVRLDCPVEVALTRNTHNVPENAIRRTDSIIRNGRFPRHWPAEKVIKTG